MNEKYNEIVEELQSEFPRFRVIPKENNVWMKILYSLSLMRFWNPDFMTAYVTVMFGRVYMPAHLIGTYTGYMILRHERVHLRDAARWPLLFELSYLFFPLPFVLTLRAYWEYRAYCESLVVEAERYGYVRRDSIEFYVGQFTGSYYLWMFPFPAFLRERFYRFLASKYITVK